MRVEVLTTERLLEGENVYKDYYFSFEPTHPLPTSLPKQVVDQLLGIDASQSLVLHVSDSTRTVTISVASVNGKLHSLDTFAPSASWVIDSNLTLPFPSDNGHLRFTAELTTGGIVTVEREMIEYRVNPDDGTVRLKLEEAQSIRYAQVANCLIAGIDKKSSDLVEIWLQDVSGL